MPSLPFHPAVARWFEQTFGSPTDPQFHGWPAIKSGGHVLISAPTGSGKTLAAFMTCLNDLFQQGLKGPLPDQTQVVYISPLKALSNDVRRNLQEPLAGIRAALFQEEGKLVDVRAELRTGDTPPAQRLALSKKPPHILVTTPESFYLLLTSQSGRQMLGAVRSVIVDEIHAVADDRRGAHLALSLERLAALSPHPIQRIGLSATQKPIREIARFLVGTRSVNHDGEPDCTIVEAGQTRRIDVAIELPNSALEAVMSNEVWEEVYRRLAELIRAHRTTLVFVNTRRMAERVTHQLVPLLGSESVTSHHGSLSARLRLEAEDRLKRGELKALVATASLELGIDIGSVDLVCQLGSTRSITTLLQRIGRAEHKRGGVPRGRLFPLTRDELVECTALLRAVRRGDLDQISIPEKPLDVLAQQIVAAAACEDWEEQKLYDLVQSAWPYRHLARTEFGQVVKMLAEGFSTKRGRRGALIHYDGVNRRIRGRRGARLLALTSGGAIPDNGDYRVVLDHNETFIGTVNEDFAVESMAGEVFQLGNASWRILRINAGSVRVADAKGQPPGIPFWLGEAPGRTAELSRAVSDLRLEIEQCLQTSRDDVVRLLQRFNDPEAGENQSARNVSPLPPASAEQMADYFSNSNRILGAIPSQETLVIERFFDESGGMQLVLHSTFGSRINRAWGLALRKRFCRSFNFELQAAATEDAIILSLGTQHSFPLESVFRYLNSKTVRGLLVQALLDAPMFAIRWRWNAARALAIPRQRGGHKMPAPLQRMEAENLLAAVFPDQLACLENIAGDREIPDHPLVDQTIRDCLTEAMEVEGLEHVLQRIENGTIRCIARDLPEPSPLAHEILNARPYAFLDNAPLEERRTRAVYTRRATEPARRDDLGMLDPAAIRKVIAEAWPDARDADEAHDALLLLGVMTEQEMERTAGADAGLSRQWLDHLEQQNRAVRVLPKPGCSKDTASETERRVEDSEFADSVPEFWVAAERLPMICAIYDDLVSDLSLEFGPDHAAHWQRPDAIRELLRGRLEVSGPTTAKALAAILNLSRSEADTALLSLESEGFILRGFFHPEAQELEWCERRLLARVHRLTLDRLRAEIEPVTQEDFCRFLMGWQRADEEHRAHGPEGLESVLETLDGCELPLAAWEPGVLGARVADYDPQWLDRLCFSGRIGWGRLGMPHNGYGRLFAPLRTSPIALFQRENLGDWLRLTDPVQGESTRPNAAARGNRVADRTRGIVAELRNPVSGAIQEPFAVRPEPAATRALLELLASGGALFFHELVHQSGLLPTQVEQALAELAACGKVTADGFDGLRALLIPSHKRAALGMSPGEIDSQIRPNHLHRRKSPVASVEFAGRWSLLRREAVSSGDGLRDGSVEKLAGALLHRYGVVFRRLLEREVFPVSWYELGRTYRRWEARGEIRGGHFVAGVGGEQFALPEAIGRLRAVRKSARKNELVTLSAADPLNLVGILSPGPRIAAVSSNRILFRDGIPIAALEAGQIRMLITDESLPGSVLERSLKVGNLLPVLRPYYA